MGWRFPGRVTDNPWRADGRGAMLICVRRGLLVLSVVVLLSEAFVGPAEALHHTAMYSRARGTFFVRGSTTSAAAPNAIADFKIDALISKCVGRPCASETTKGRLVSAGRFLLFRGDPCALQASRTTALEITWNTGLKSKAATVVWAFARPVITTAARITSGVFKGDWILVVFSANTPRPCGDSLHGTSTALSGRVAIAHLGRPQSDV